jgi:hypothetical protein
VVGVQRERRCAGLDLKDGCTQLARARVSPNTRAPPPERASILLRVPARIGDARR